MTQYDESDASKDTDSSEKEVNEAWHDARDDAAEEGGWGVPKDRHGDKDDDSGSGDSGK